MTGTITKLLLERDYGFLEPFGKGDALFFHRSDVAPELGWNETLQFRRVEFHTLWRGNREAAVDVRPIN